MRSFDPVSGSSTTSRYASHTSLDLIRIAKQKRGFVLLTSSMWLTPMNLAAHPCAAREALINQSFPKSPFAAAASRGDSPPD